MRFLTATFLIAGVLSAQTPAAQDVPKAPLKNPSEGKPEAIRAGREAYSTRCASCHGADAKGSTGGSDLTGLWTAGGADQQLFQSIRRGLPNSIKVHSFGPDNDIWAILAYLRTLDTGMDTGTPGAKPTGNAENGQRVFAANCAACHIVNGQGGHLGPELSQVGMDRSRPFLAHKVRHASSYFMSVWAPGGYIADGYQPVTLVTRDGQRIRGIKKNEDAFSVQIMDTKERLRGFPKSTLKEMVNDDASLMPDFGTDKLSDHDLDDLLAYLGTLRGGK